MGFHTPTFLWIAYYESAFGICFLSLYIMSLSLGHGNFARVRCATLGGCPFGESLAAFPWHGMSCSDAQVPGKVCAFNSQCLSLWAELGPQHQPGILPPHISTEVETKHLQTHPASRRRQTRFSDDRWEGWERGFKSTSDTVHAVSVCEDKTDHPPKNNSSRPFLQRLVGLKGPELWVGVVLLPLI